MTRDLLNALNELVFNWNALADSSRVNVLDMFRRLRRGHYEERLQREFNRLVESARERGVPLDAPDG